KRFDTAVAGLAAEAGAELALRTELEAATRDDPADGSRSLPLRSAQGPALSAAKGAGGALWTLQGRHLGLPFTVRARVLVAADGVGSRIAKWLRVNSTLPLHEAASCIQYEMTNVPTD